MNTNQPRDIIGRFESPVRGEVPVNLGIEPALLAEAREKYGDCVTPHHIDLPEGVHSLLDQLHATGMNPLLVGGSVRDSFDGTTPKDLDFEIYGANIADVEAAASHLGRVDAVGKKYGVLKMTLDGADLDLSVPRRDNKVGIGHRGFSVDFDPDLDVAEASARRDFTINAMSYDPRLRVLIDPHGGRQDLDDGVLRHISAAFAEDPLRVVRGMQFASRFSLTMHPDTVTLAQSLRPEAATLHPNGMSAEWEKWAHKARRHSDGLIVLAQTEWDQELPGLAGVNDTQTRADVDATAHLVREDISYTGRFDERVILGAVLMRRMDPADAQRFAAWTISGKDTQRQALALAFDQRELPHTSAQAREQALTTPSIRARCLLAAGTGRNEAATETLRLAEQAGVADTHEPDLLNGPDIMATAPDVRAGRWIAETLNAARLAQARGEFRDRDDALAWLTER